MQKKLILVFTVFIIGLFVSSYALGDVTTEGIYFCADLHKEDVIKWHFVIYKPISEEAPDLEMPNNTDITLTIVQDLANVNFVNISCQNFTEYFNLKYGNITETFEIDESLYLFLMPIKIEFSNGTEYNPCKSDWIYAIFDDLYYAEEENKALTITIKNDIVVYDAWLVYPTEDAKIIIKAEISYRTGIMQYLNWKYLSASNETEFIDAVIDNIEQPNILDSPFSWSYALISMLVLPIIVKRRKKAI